MLNRLNGLFGIDPHQTSALRKIGLAMLFIPALCVVAVLRVIR